MNESVRPLAGLNVPSVDIRKIFAFDINPIEYYIEADAKLRMVNSKRP